MMLYPVLLSFGNELNIWNLWCRRRKNLATFWSVSTWVLLRMVWYLKPHGSPCIIFLSLSLASHSFLMLLLCCIKLLFLEQEQPSEASVMFLAISCSFRVSYYLYQSGAILFLVISVPSEKDVFQGALEKGYSLIYRVLYWYYFFVFIYLWAVIIINRTRILNRHSSSDSLQEVLPMGWIGWWCFWLVKVRSGMW